MKVSIVIPVYNEAATVRQLLDRVYAQPVPVEQKELIIVASPSTDNSLEVVQAFLDGVEKQENTTIQLITQEEARGKGYAVRAGLKACTGDIVMIQDADLEYDTADYPALLEPIQSGRVDFVLGSRHMAAGNWKIRNFKDDLFVARLMNFAGIFLHAFFNVVYGQRLTDPTTMYKVFRRTCLRGLSFEANRFDFDWEILGKLVRKGYIPLEVPVSYTSRGFAEGKKIRFWPDPVTWLYAICKYRVARLDGPNPILDTEMA